MKARRIAPHHDDYQVHHFTVIGRTPRELEFHCNQLNVVQRDGKFFLDGEQEIKDDEWIIQPCDEGPYVLSAKEFHKQFDLCRDYVKWDPSHQFGHLNQAMHLVNEVEAGRGKVTVHEMAWGLFRNGTIREFFRQDICTQWSQDLAAPWKICDKCTDGKIRFTEEDYERFRKEESAFAKSEPEFWTHTFCKVCSGVGYVWRLSELGTADR